MTEGNTNAHSGGRALKKAGMHITFCILQRETSLNWQPDHRMSHQLSPWRGKIQWIDFKRKDLGARLQGCDFQVLHIWATLFRERYVSSPWPHYRISKMQIIMASSHIVIRRIELICVKLVKQCVTIVNSQWISVIIINYTPYTLED